MSDNDKKHNTQDDINVSSNFSDSDYGDSFFRQAVGHDYNFDEALSFTKTNYAKIIRELEDK